MVDFLLDWVALHRATAPVSIHSGLFSRGQESDRLRKVASQVSRSLSLFLTPFALLARGSDFFRLNLFPNAISEIPSSLKAVTKYYDVSLLPFSCFLKQPTTAIETHQSQC
jgi:hypothetical protein